MYVQLYKHAFSENDDSAFCKHCPYMQPFQTISITLIHFNEGTLGLNVHTCTVQAERQVSRAGKKYHHFDV